MEAPLMSLNGMAQNREKWQQYNDYIEQMRKTEYPMLKGTTYLDHAGTTLYAKSLIEAFSQDMLANLLGNPHSASSASSSSSRRVEETRLKVLQLFKASPEEFDVVFVANATAGIKLVAEAFSGHEDGFWYGYHKDSHTSLVGVRECARKHKCFESFFDFQSDAEVVKWCAGDENVPESEDCGLKLFAYPAQSNMNGFRLPREWCSQLRKNRPEAFSLLDAASLVSTSFLDLSDAEKAPDFTVLSFYKMFGFPDLGALIVRKQAGHVFRHRKYFGGGTVEMVTCLKEQWHIIKEDSLHERLEDGTLPVHSIIALDNAIKIHARLYGTFEHISTHTMMLFNKLAPRLYALRHHNGVPAVQVYEALGLISSQGPILAFNLRDAQEIWISTTEVEKLAGIRNIQLRSGGLCNPGGIASSLNLSPWEMKRNFSAGHRCGNENDIMGGKPTGMIRVSFGAMSTMSDVDTFVAFIEEFFVEKAPFDRASLPPTSTAEFYVESLMIYPIKSCGGWRIPSNTRWDIHPEGFAWDREWCLLQQSNRKALSQKRFPAMALFKPRFDFAAGLLHVRWTGPTPPSGPEEIAIPLSPNPAQFMSADVPDSQKLSVCGDEIRAQIYTSPIISTFFSTILQTPCYLARFPAQGTGLSLRHAKPRLQHTSLSPPPPSSLLCKQSLQDFLLPAKLAMPQPHPLLLSNESPILAISRSSLNRLNETIKLTSSNGKAAAAEVFRANIVLAEGHAAAPGLEQHPYAEDSWTFVSLVGADGRESAGLDVLGACRRCQMVCVDQVTGKSNPEPFCTLAKTRRVAGKVYFGVHMGLGGGRGKMGSVRVGDVVRAR
jgi:molybdenum cofactor sulfurtransferase